MIASTSREGGYNGDPLSRSRGGVEGQSANTEGEGSFVLSFSPLKCSEHDRVKTLPEAEEVDEG